MAGCRTPIGTAGHGLAGLTAVDLAAPVLAEVARRAAPLDLPVTEVLLGNCLGPGGNPARSAALAAGLGLAVPAVTVDRQCGSGLEALRIAALTVRSEGRDLLLLAGGAESASTAPWRFWPPRQPGDTPARYTRAPFAPLGFPDPEMGPAADDLARLRQIPRRRQDAYAARSHQRARLAQAAGRFADELVPVGGLTADERPRPLSVERLARLRPAFAAGTVITIAAPGETDPDNGTADNTTPRTATADSMVTAGNSSGISDGAAALAVTTAGAARAAGMDALWIRSTAVAAADPALPGAVAAPAARLALRRAGLAAGDLGAIEVTEAFAAVALAFADDLGVDETLLCADGGAVALGHPWGASGAVLAVRLLAQMLPGGGPEIGLAACAIGGGQGIAMVLQRVGAP